MITGQATNQDNMNQAIKQAIANQTSGDIVTIGARCIAEIGNSFFLLVELRIGTAPLRQVLVIRISQALAALLLAEGIDRCRIVDTIPVSTPGRTVTLICSFVVGSNTFLVFSIENTVDELLLVRVPLCIVI